MDLAVACSNVSASQGRRDGRIGGGPAIMLTLRCTRRLMDHLGIKPTPAGIPEPFDSLLGDWYAGLVQLIGVAPLMLCVNEPTRYAIVIQLEGGEDLGILHACLTEGACEAVRRVGASRQTVRRVEKEYADGVRIAATQSRSVLGTMNDLARLLEGYLGGLSGAKLQEAFADVEDYLNVVPHRPLGMDNATMRLRGLCAK
jgi:hypothetical protein